MKINILCLFIFLYTINIFANINDSHFNLPEFPDVTEVQDTSDTERVVVYWEEKNAVGLNLNEVAFVNWSSGGNNSFSTLFHGDFERNYRKEHLSWKNGVSIRYGLSAQEGRELRKNEDEIRFESSFGYRSSEESSWFYSSKLTFRSQFAHGYKYPETHRPISKFMAPGYFTLGVGIDYSPPNEDLDVHISPLTQKSTFVLDQRLANEGMFGVEKAVTDELGNIVEEGEKVRNEIGFNLTGNYSKEVFENVRFKSQISLYSDWLRKFGNVDVDWRLDVNMKVNDFIKASFGSQVRYDDDVKHKEDTNGDGDLETVGPRIQFKQTLGVGIVYEF